MKNILVGLSLLALIGANSFANEPAKTETAPEAAVEAGHTDEHKGAEAGHTDEHKKVAKKGAHKAAHKATESAPAPAKK